MFRFLVSKSGSSFAIALMPENLSPKPCLLEVLSERPELASSHLWACMHQKKERVCQLCKQAHEKHEMRETVPIQECSRIGGAVVQLVRRVEGVIKELTDTALASVLRPKPLIQFSVGPSFRERACVQKGRSPIATHALEGYTTLPISEGIT